MSEPEQLSEEYRRVKASMDSYEVWEGMDEISRRELLLTRYPPASWYEDDNIPTLAGFRSDKQAWGRIKAKGKEQGLNTYDFEVAVDAWIVAHRNGDAAHENPHGTPLIVTFDTLADEVTEWLWWPYLPIGGLVMLDGDPGLGKSLLSTMLAAVLSNGWKLPDQQGKLTLPTGPPSDTLILSAEDSLTRTIKRRLTQAQATLARVHALTGWTDAGGAKQWFTLQHMPVLEEALLGCPATKLVIIDPIQAYLGAIDMHRSNETRPLLAALSDLAERHRLTVCCVRHPSKPGQAGTKALHRGLGSIDFIGAARSGLFVEAHPVDDSKVLLAQTKNNLDRLGRTQVFSKRDGIFAWVGVTRLNVEQLAGTGRGPDQHVFLEAFCWLEDHLKGGLAWPSRDVEQQMEDEGWKPGVIVRAKKMLGVVSAKRPDGSWTWRLPDLSLIVPPTVSPDTSTSSSTSSTSTTSISSVREPGDEDF